MKRKRNLIEAFKWANSELKTGRNIIAIVNSWGANTYDELIDYFEQAKEAGEEKIIKALRKQSVLIKQYEKQISNEKHTRRKA